MLYWLKRKLQCNWLRAGKLIINFHLIVLRNPDVSSPQFLHPFSFPWIYFYVLLPPSLNPLDFANPFSLLLDLLSYHFTPDLSNQFSFYLDILLCNFTPDFSNLLVSRTNFRFPWMSEKTAFLLEFHECNLFKHHPWSFPRITKISSGFGK